MLEKEPDLIERLSEDNMFGTATPKEIKTLCKVIKEMREAFRGSCLCGECIVCNCLQRVERLLQ